MPALLFSPDCSKCSGLPRILVLSATRHWRLTLNRLPLSAGKAGALPVAEFEPKSATVEPAGRAVVLSVIMGLAMMRWPCGEPVEQPIVCCRVRRDSGCDCRSVGAIGRPPLCRTAKVRQAAVPPGAWLLENNRCALGTAIRLSRRLRSGFVRLLPTTVRRQSWCCRRCRIPGRSVERTPGWYPVGLWVSS